jgi:hypothetical protein
MNLKTSFNWRQIIKTPKFEYCSGLKLGTIIPYIASHIGHIKYMFPSLNLECPMKPSIYAANYTFVRPDNIKATRTKAVVTSTTRPFMNIENIDGFPVMGLN